MKSQYTTNNTMATNNHEIGSLVRLHGLNNAAYNGRLGRVIDVSSLDTNGRVLFKLLDEVHLPLLQEIKIKPDNLLSEQPTTRSDFELRGVTIALFRAIVQEALERNPDKNYWNMGRVSAELIGNHEILLKPDCRFGLVDKVATLTFATYCSLIEMLKSAHCEIPHATLRVTYDQAVGTNANVFVSFSYGDNLMDLVEGLELFLKDEQRDPMETYFWFDPFVNDQWHALDHDFDWWANTFSTAVESIGETVIFLSPWDQPGMLKRAWCLIEISCSKKISVAISRAQKDAFVTTFRVDSDEIYKALCTIDLEKATSFLPEDMERISAVVRAKEGGFHHFNMLVVAKMRGWVEETARALVMGMGVENDQMDEVTMEQLADLVRTASLLSDGGKLEEAKAMNERALRGQEKTLGSDHPDTLVTVNNLANLLAQQGKLDEAKVMFERALRGKEKIWGSDHPDTLSTVHNLGFLLTKQGKLDEAKVTLDRALRGKEKALGPDHLDTLDTVNNLAILLAQQNKLDEAKVMWDRALRGRDKALGPDHPETLNAVGNLGGLLKNQGKLDEAKVMYDRALRGREKALGSDHPSTLNMVNNLAILLKDQGKLNEAKAMWDRSLRGRDKTLGLDHPDTLSTVNYLGGLLLAQGKLDEAKTMFDRALRGYEKVLGPDHPDTLGTVNNLGNLLLQQRKLDKAKIMLDRALRGQEKALGPDHPNTLNTVYNLALLLKDQGNVDQAKAFFQRCYEGYVKIYGDDHSETFDAKAQVNRLS